MRFLLTLFHLFTFSLFTYADAVDSLEQTLLKSPQIQEKIYIHTDNNCYFIGDTIWYKAYVLRSDDLRPTNLSRLLYVELLSPDGIVVERQRVTVSSQGNTCGQFCLKDSLYSGYYELRAYTRWQLNFNVTEKEHNFLEDRKFYNKKLAADFYRDYEGLYSRVLPVYSKPNEAGNYADRYMFSRPKQRILKEHKALHCNFYPEGGHIIDGHTSRVAYELYDNNGEGITVEGRFDDGRTVKPQHGNRGVMEYTPGSGRKLTFRWNDKDWTFSLPKAESSGVTLRYNSETSSVSITSVGVKAAAMSLTCRGRCYEFRRLYGAASSVEQIDTSKLPTGINEIIIYDADAQPLASRLFFVNHNDMGGELNVSINSSVGEITDKVSVKPFQLMNLAVEAESHGGSYPKTVSVSIRDRRTDDPSYDNGNILTDMLLSGDLKGFVAYPAYYFEKDDAQHRANLDLLLMVQGWRKYKRIAKGRYLPETSLTFEGQVLKLPSNVSFPDVTDFLNITDQNDATADLVIPDEPEVTLDSEATDDQTGITESPEPEVEYVTESENDVLDIGRLRRPVIVEAELSKDKEVAGVCVRTDSKGYFKFQLPPYYDSAILRVKAYNVKDSLRKCMTAIDKNLMDDHAYPDYYVRREMFYPIFSHPYSWYQTNAPEMVFVDEDDDALIPENSRLAGDHRLQTVIVKSKRRGKRGIDYTKPALVRDIYSLYNDVTDYGLSFGIFNVLRFPRQAATLLYGNMGQITQFNIRATIDGTSFYRNYTPNVGAEYDKNMAGSNMERMLHLDRLLNVRAYTDYELRTDSGAVFSRTAPDLTFVFEPIPNDGKRYTYRDRRYVLEGITYAEEFYNRDYSNTTLPDPKDYRRTLYWNPNAVLDENGRFSATLYNNSRESRIAVTATGVSSDGKLYYKK